MNRREVEFQEGINFAKKHGFEFFAETSAVDGTNVETVKILNFVKFKQIKLSHGALKKFSRH